MHRHASKQVRRQATAQCSVQDGCFANIFMGQCNALIIIRDDTYITYQANLRRLFPVLYTPDLQPAIRRSIWQIDRRVFLVYKVFKSKLPVCSVRYLYAGKAVKPQYSGYGTGYIYTQYIGKYGRVYDSHVWTQKRNHCRHFFNAKYLCENTSLSVLSFPSAICEPQPPIFNTFL